MYMASYNMLNIITMDKPYSITEQDPIHNLDDKYHPLSIAPYSCGSEGWPGFAKIPSMTTFRSFSHKASFPGLVGTEI